MGAAGAARARLSARADSADRARPARRVRAARDDHDNGAVIEVPFGIGDGLSTGRGSQDRRLLYHATIHGHPVVGGYIGRMPPNVAQAYDAMPVVGNLLRLSSGEEAIEEDAPACAAVSLSRARHEHGVARARRLRAADARHGSDRVGRRQAVVCRPGRAAREHQSVAIITAKQMRAGPERHPSPSAASTASPHHM